MPQYAIRVYGQRGGLPDASGAFTVPGYFANLNSRFGFNTSPHQFDVEVVKQEFGGDLDDLPEIGEVVEIILGSGFFPITGRVNHIEYSESMNGTSMAIHVQDRRVDLDEVAIFTDDIGDKNTLQGKGIISVGGIFRQDGFAQTEYEEYKKIHDEGATYYQIYRAAVDNAVVLPSGLTPEKIFPAPAKLISNIPSLGSDEDRQVLLANYRWKFNGDTLRNVITSILDDLGFDWYWAMQSNEVKLINRSITFDIDPDNIPTATDTAKTVSIRYGKDDTQSNDNHVVLGAQQEGFIDSSLLSSIDGLSTPSGFVFRKAWDNLTVGFFDAQGAYRSYKILEKELKVALISIEVWSYFKKYQVSKFGLVQDSGVIAAQHSDFQSRIDPALNNTAGGINPSGNIRVISNRRDLESNWILEWYEKVRQLAASHFGRTYYAEDVLSHPTHGKFELADAAWCNLENQLGTGFSQFVEGYKIHSTYNVFAPFVNSQFKVGAHVVLPGFTVYGANGQASPAQFDRWNEDDDGTHPQISGAGLHYIPVSLFEVSDEFKDPRDVADPFSAFKPGTVICQMPQIVASALVQDTILKNLETVKTLKNLATSGVIDILSLDYLPEPYHTLNSQVAIPVRSHKRYGTGYPAFWTSDPSGTLDNPKRKMVIDDRFAPWNFSPGPSLDNDTVLGTSVEYMSRVAKNLIEAKSRFADKTTFGEVVKEGFPQIAFDNFSDDDGRPVNGITGLSTQFGINGWQTTYSLKSHFDEFGEEAPLGEAVRGRIEGIVHPIDFFEIKPPEGQNVVGAFQAPNFTPTPSFFTIFPDTPLKTVDVQIDRIDYLDPLAHGQIWNEGYQGVVLRSSNGVTLDTFTEQRVPASYSGEIARCTDGFLNVGDVAKYTSGMVGGVKISFFSGGKRLDLFRATVKPGTVVDVTEGATTYTKMGVVMMRSQNNPAGAQTFEFSDVRLEDGYGKPSDNDKIFVKLLEEVSVGKLAFLSNNQAFKDSFVSNLRVVTSKGSAQAVKVSAIVTTPGTPRSIIKVRPISSNATADDISDVSVVGFDEINITESLPIGAEGILAVDAKDSKKYFFSTALVFRA